MAHNGKAMPKRPPPKGLKDNRRSMFRYFGSKASTANIVTDLALVGLDGINTVADAFGGLGNIGAEFKKRGHAVTTCDLLAFPHAFQHVRIECQKRPSFRKLRSELGVCSEQDIVKMLNSPDLASAWFKTEYSDQRLFFTEENALRIGSAWSKICIWSESDWISKNEEKFLIASLLNSLDAVANTAGTYYAHLKGLGRKPLKTFNFKWLDITDGPIAGTSLQGDALECLKGKKFDILYLDPPYNDRDYSRYYHLPETLSQLKEIDIDSSSKAGLPVSRPTAGSFIRSAMRLPYLAELIESVTWERLVVQYADGAYIPLSDLKNLLCQYGELEITEIQALGYQSRNGSRKQAHHVFVVNA